MAHILDTISFGKIVQIRDQLLKAQALGKKVYRLESGDPSFSIAPHVLNAIREAGEKGKTHYVANNGIPELQRALKAKLESKNNIAVPSAENVFVTNGAMHALFLTFSSLLDPGDEVIVPDPMWTEVVEHIRLAGGSPVPVKLTAQNSYMYSPSDIETKITQRTKVLFLNSPHNPTGAVLDKETLLQIAEIGKRRNLYIVTDEAYEDVIYEPAVHYSIAALVPDYLDRIVSIFSFSKSHAMSGLRVGYVVTTDKRLCERIPKLLRCSINGVNSIAQWAAVAAVSGSSDHMSDMQKEYGYRRSIMYEAVSGIAGIKPFFPKGAFYLWAELEPNVYKKLHVKDADELSAFLADRGIGNAPGSCFGTCTDAIRFSFSASTEMVREGSEKLREILMTCNS
ncbi:MAG: aminotransferase class I/II-fold pyridoxal phosphate-dependent enzyme [Deltaproteobacteria bacterium]|nr:aminotransferase class I/II-fold pyridoxal phosphate-dependent enzyme [Deltaproteobacteria bacterium]